MTQTMSIRIDADARKGLTNVCKELGLSVSAAFNIFAKKVANDRKIPFELALEPIENDGNSSFNKLRNEAKSKNLKKMSLKDINKKIADTRKHTK